MPYPPNPYSDISLLQPGWLANKLSTPTQIKENRSFENYVKTQMLDRNLVRVIEHAMTHGVTQVESLINELPESLDAWSQLHTSASVKTNGGCTKTGVLKTEDFLKVLAGNFPIPARSVTLPVVFVQNDQNWDRGVIAKLTLHWNPNGSDERQVAPYPHLWCMPMRNRFIDSINGAAHWALDASCDVATIPMNSGNLWWNLRWENYELPFLDGPSLSLAVGIGCRLLRIGHSVPEGVLFTGELTSEGVALAVGSDGMNGENNRPGPKWNAVQQSSHINAMVVIREHGTADPFSTNGKLWQPVKDFAAALDFVNTWERSFIGWRIDNRVPAEGMRCFGRDKAFNALIAKLFGYQALITLTGLPGVGKSALARILANEAAKNPEHRVVYISLMEKQDPAAILEAINSAIKGPKETESELQCLEKASIDRKVFIFIDNIEHLLYRPLTYKDADGNEHSGVAQLLADLMRIRGVRVLVTSTINLHVVNNENFNIEPLAVRLDPKKVSWRAALNNPAVQLFVSVRQGVVPAFQLNKLDKDDVGAVVAICRKLNGIPLGIRIVAALDDRLTPRQMYNDLQLARQLSPQGTERNHMSLTAAFEASYNLLSPEQKELFNHLGVFSASFVAETVGAIFEMDATQVEGLLGILASRNLIEYDATTQKYSLFSTVREFAHAKLTDTGEEAYINSKYTAFFLRRAEANRLFYQSPSKGWPQQIKDNIEDFHAIIMAPRDTVGLSPNVQLRMAASLWHFWWRHGYAREVVPALKSLLKDNENTKFSDEWANACFITGHLTRHLGNLDEGKRYFADALSVYLTSNNQVGAALVFLQLAVLADHNRDFFTADRLIATADIFTSPEDTVQRAAVAYEHGNSLRSRNLYGKALDRLNEAQQLYMKVSDDRAAATASLAMGNCSLGLEDLPAAQAHYENALTYFLDNNDTSRLILTLERLAVLISLRGSTNLAARLIGHAMHLRQDIEVPIPRQDKTEYYDALLLQLTQQLGNAEFNKEQSKGAKMKRDTLVRELRRTFTAF